MTIIDIQWRIQDFSDRRGGSLTCYLTTFWAKTAWKLKKLDREGSPQPLDPTIIKNLLIN